MGQQLGEALARALSRELPAVEENSGHMPYPFEKYVRNGNAAVLYSPGYGGGWWSWSGRRHEGILFDADIVRALLAQDYDQIRWLVVTRYPGTWLGEVENLAIKWVPVGARFEISEYDGAESVRLLDKVPRHTA